MTTNFSVSDASIDQYVKDGGIEVTRYKRNGSAVGQAITATGGKTYPNLPPVPTTIGYKYGQTKVDSQAESTRTGSQTAPQSARQPTNTSLLVKAWPEWESTTRQSMMAELHGTRDPDMWGAQLVATKSPAIYAGFDSDFLSTALSSPTDVEWAGNGIAVMNSVMAAYDETAYNGDAMILTRKGARLFGFAENADNMLQFPGGVQSIPFDGPILRTDATAADIGTPNLLGVVGPFSACAWGWSGDTTVELFNQLEQVEGGAREQLLTWLVNRYMGAVAPPTAAVPAAAWTTITDDS